MKPTVGLTGGIASGKSTVARQLRELGVAVVDADALAREVVAPGSAGLAALQAAFGDEIVAEDGTLDRKRLGAHVFADSEARARLNAITHPRIAALSAERIAQARATPTPYVVYEAALLVEGGLHQGLDALIVVTARDDVQVRRAQQRDGLSEQQARDRIAAQLPTSAKVAAADYVIENDGDLAHLRHHTEDVHRQILQRFHRSHG